MRTTKDESPEFEFLPDPTACRDILVDDLRRVATRDRWGRAFMRLGWIHLAFFGACHVFYDPKVHGDPRHVILWVLEVATVVGVLRASLGRGWTRSTPLAGVLARVWGTFFILAFNVATINSLTGWDVNWFKLTWATLSTFGFATTAWLTSPWFLVPAVQMYLTGLLMVRHPASVYLIYGVSWWASLQGIGWVLERRSRASALGAGARVELDRAEEPSGSDSEFDVMTVAETVGAGGRGRP